MSMGTAKKKTLKITDVVGKKVRLHSPLWIQGYCDGECIGYESKRGIFLFRRNGQKLDEGTYEVRGTSQFEIL
jgi:hypothetical protein